MRRRILLADDSVTIQKVIELTFMDEDYDVKAVSNGDEAVAALPEMTPDFVIADVHMPGANGYEVCRRAKELRPDVPVLLLVGTFEPFDEGQARAAGADSFLKKPFDSQELLQRVQDLLAPPAPSQAEPPAAGIPEALPPLDLGLPELTPSSPMEEWPEFQLTPEAAPPEPEAAAPAEPFPPSYPPAPPLAPREESPFLFEEEQAASAFEVEESVPLPAGEPMFDFEAPAPGEPALGSIDLPEELPEAPRPPAGFAWPAEAAASPAPEARIEAPSLPIPPAIAAAPEPEPTAPVAAAAEWRPTEPHPVPAIPIAPAAPVPLGTVSVNGGLSDQDVDRIARRVVDLLGDKAVRDVAWEVIPDLAELVIRDRLRELESQVETPAE